MAQIFVSTVAHFFVSASGSKFHERMAHFFIDIYTRIVLTQKHSSGVFPAEYAQV